MILKLSITLLIAFTANFVCAQPSLSPAQAALSEQTTARIVVKYREANPPEQVKALSDGAATEREKRLAKSAKYPLRHVKVMSGGAVVYHLGTEITLSEAKAAAARIAQDPSVEYAEPDIRVGAHQAAALTNDTFSQAQWPLMSRTSAAGGANFATAWALTRGSGVVIGLVDSGILGHPDLAGQTVPGYDFVSEDAPNFFPTAGDGDGRDSDPTDPGNFCKLYGVNSDWHGTKVASVLVSLANNGYGIAGAAPSAKVMSLRAIGRCGGFASDVADAIAWAAGAPIAGIPLNYSPVQVINLSLGGAPGTTCPAYMQAAITSAISRGVPVVASAGNDGAADIGSPANCSGVIVVGAHTLSADLTSYSNRSPLVTLTAPGGGKCMSQGATCRADFTVAADNDGLTVAGAMTEANVFTGTSAAAPYVVAAIALIRGINPTMTPNEIKALLKATATPHAPDSYCAANAGACGAGMLDANAAVTAAFAPIVAITRSYMGPSVEGGITVTLTAAVSGGMGSTYLWEQVSGPAVSLTGVTTSMLSFKTAAVSPNLVFKVTATTALGTVTTSSVTVIVNNPPVLSTKAFSATEHSNASLALVGADPEGGALVYNLVEGPAGMTLSGNVLQWAVGTAGSYSATVTLTDASGLVATEKVALTSLSVASPPTGDQKGSGGGGAIDWLALVLMSLGLAALGKSRK